MAKVLVVDSDSVFAAVLARPVPHLSCRSCSVRRLSDRTRGSGREHGIAVDDEDLGQGVISRERGTLYCWKAAGGAEAGKGLPGQQGHQRLQGLGVALFRP